MRWEQQLEQVHAGLAAHVDAVHAELAVARGLIRFDLLAVLLEVRYLLDAGCDGCRPERPT